MIRSGEPAELAVEIAGDYLAHVTRWLAGRTGFRGRLMDNAVLRQRLAAAVVAYRAAEAVLSEFALVGDRVDAEVVHAIAVRCAVDCVRWCADVHAGAGVFDTRPDIVHRMYLDELHDHPLELGHGWPGPLGRLRPGLAARLRSVVVSSLSSSAVPPPALVTAEARRLVAGLEEVCPVATTTLLDDLVTAEALAMSLAPGLAARVMTHRQVVRGYLTGPDAAPVSSRLLAGARTGDVLTAIAVTEPEVGSDLSSLAAVIQDGSSTLVLDGVKTYVAGGADCDAVLVAARSGADLRLAWVDPRRPEVARRVLPTRAWRGVGFAELRLQSYQLSIMDIHAGHGAGTLLTGLVRERMILAAQQLAYARRWITDVPAWSRAEIAWRLPAAQVLLERAVASADNIGPSIVDSSIAKVACCAAAAHVAVARTAALAATHGGARADELLDDQASARACTFAGGTADINLALVEGCLQSFLAGQQGESRERATV